jgi:hypothetical protein
MRLVQLTGVLRLRTIGIEDGIQQTGKRRLDAAVYRAVDEDVIFAPKSLVDAPGVLLLMRKVGSIGVEDNSIGIIGVGSRRRVVRVA